MAGYVDIKTEQSVYSEIGSFLKDFLNNIGLSDWSGNIIQWGQASIQNLVSPCVLMNLSDRRKYGLQGTDYRWDSVENKGYSDTIYYKMIDLSLTFYREDSDMLLSDFNPQTYNSTADVAEKIRTYILSDNGIETLKNLGYGTLNINQITNPTFETEENTYARTPNMVITLVYGEKITEDYNDFISYEQQKITIGTNLRITNTDYFKY